MDRLIVAVSERALPADDCVRHLADAGYGTFEFFSFPTWDDAEPLLFERSVSLIVVDVSVEGTTEAVAMLKKDDMFSHVPTLAVIAEPDAASIKRVSEVGFDAWIPVDDVNAAETLLPVVVRPLIAGFQRVESLLNKTSELQEAGIKDFILLDLIKDYIPKTIWDIAQQFAHEQKIEIPEEEMDLTIVFADLKGFTPMTQHMAPREVIQTLNSVFAVASRIVYEFGGDIDKFLGDAFFAVFTDATRAVKAMVRLQVELGEVNDTRRAEGLPTVEFRIGIHSGPVIRGNVGGNHRFDNTLIGDTVNTASRLEALAPPGGIMISEETRARVGTPLPSTTMQRVPIRGRDEKITVYSLPPRRKQEKNDRTD